MKTYCRYACTWEYKHTFMYGNKSENIFMNYVRLTVFGNNIHVLINLTMGTIWKAYWFIA